MLLLVYPLLWLTGHVFNVENLSDILGQDKQLVSIPKIVEFNYCHPILIFCYPSSRQLNPLATKQRHLEIGTVIQLPYLFNVAVICVLFLLLSMASIRTPLFWFFYLGLLYKMCFHLSRTLGMLIFQYGPLANKNSCSLISMLCIRCFRNQLQKVFMCFLEFSCVPRYMGQPRMIVEELYNALS